MKNNFREYKFIAEFSGDAETFISIAKEKIIVVLRDKFVFGEAFTFKSNMTLVEIIKLLRTISDGHVMCETIQCIEKFTGERTWDDGEKLLKTEIRKDKIAKLICDD